MELPELVRKNAEKLCDAMCQRLNNDPAEERLFGYRIEGEVITLYARRGVMQKLQTTPLARFRFSTELNQWALQHYDDGENWRPYLNAGPSLHLGQLMVHVEQDPFGFFRDEPSPPDLA